MTRFAEIFSPDTLSDAQHAIRDRGYHCIDNVFSFPIIDDARRQAVAAVDRNGGEYVCVEDQGGLSGPLLGEFFKDPSLSTFCDNLCDLMRAPVELASGLRQTFRCLKGRQGQVESRYLHFDSYALTVIVPVAIPETGPSGDLILVRRTRPIRRFYLVNVVEKALLDRRATQNLLWRLINNGTLSIARVRLVPGSVYIFRGYQTLHTNEPCDPDALRATAIFHHGPIHSASASRRWIDGVRNSASRSLRKRHVPHGR